MKRTEEYGIVIDAKKLRALRGTRARRDIVEQGGPPLTISRLYEWEHGLCQPSTSSIPALLKGLGVSFDEILVDEVAA